MVYKQGCTDRAVVVSIQQAVGVKADGIWGPKTTEAVKAWQRDNGLTPDGIVGPKTLAAMGLGTACRGIVITKAPISTHITHYTDRQVRYIALHYTAGRSSEAGAAMANRNVFVQRPASADFVVDDKTVVQVNPDLRNCYCWAVGGKLNKWTSGGRLYGVAINRNTISIEMCSTLQKGTSAAAPNHEGWSVSDEVLERTRLLVRWLMQQYGIPRERVVRHYDITGKLCPGIIGWNDGQIFTTDGKQTDRRSDSSKWDEFWRSL